IAEILRRVADMDGNALPAQALDIGVVGLVRALHPITETVQRLGNAAHADAADSDEMNRPDIPRHLQLHSPIPPAMAIPSTASASKRAASGRPAAFAAAAIAASSCGGSIQPDNSAASSSAVSSCCRRTTAPPAAASASALAA